MCTRRLVITTPAKTFTGSRSAPASRYTSHRPGRGIHHAAARVWKRTPTVRSARSDAIASRTRPRAALGRGAGAAVIDSGEEGEAAGDDGDRRRREDERDRLREAERAREAAAEPDGLDE